MVEYKVGIDVGGTFTDLVALPHDRSNLLRLKVSSTPEDPSDAAEEGMKRLLRRLPAEAEIVSVTHGTTIGLNAIIQRAGGTVALVVSRGFPDLLEIGRSRMANSFDLHATGTRPLVSRDHVLEIDARLDPDGNPVREVSNDSIASLAARIHKLKPDSVVLNLLHGYAGVAHEVELAARIQTHLDAVPVMSAAELWPEVREYERSLVAVMGAHIQGTLSAYLGRLSERIHSLGVSAPLFISASNGGTLSLESAMQRPLDTVLSGPASGVTAARLHYPGENLITFDMGGTSSDISVVVDGVSKLTTSTEIGGLALIMPVVDVAAIGAGGGSVIWVDETGHQPALRVGPDSVGAFPGPACYGMDGHRAAVTDAYLMSGIISTDGFLGGSMKLDEQAARCALANVGARIVGFNSEADAAVDAADAALRLTTAQMTTELQKLLAERALDPREFTLVPFGGAGPTHAAMLAEELGATRVRIPDAAATYCALGAALAPLRRDFVHSIRSVLSPDAVTRCRAAIAELIRRGRAWLQEGGDDPEAGYVAVSLDMRHPLQAYELTIELGQVPLADLPPGYPPDSIDAETIHEAFSTEHSARYGFVNATAPLEIGTLRVAVTGRPSHQTANASGTISGPDGPAPLPVATRSVRWRERWENATVYDAKGWAAGGTVDGCAIVEHSDTTIFVPPDWTARMLPDFDLLLTWKGTTP